MKPRVLRLAAILGATCLVSLGAFGQSCYEATILSPSPFMGNNGEIFRLSDGSVWEVKYEYEYLYEYSPNVIVCPGRGKLVIKGKSLSIETVSPTAPAKRSPQKSAAATAPKGRWTHVEETYIQGMVSGIVQQGTIFKTISGNVYEVTGATAQAVALAQPEVTILRSGEVYKLAVQGMMEPVICQKLN
jgi:hypothetical protein